jgi:hypothetical protein
MASPALEAQIPWKRIHATFVLVPDRTFFHFAGAVWGTFKKYREALIADTDAKLDKPGGSGLRVQKLQQKKQAPKGYPGQRSLFFTALPRRWKRKPGQSLQDISGEAFTHSEVALGLETGGTFRSKRSKFLALPIGATLRSDGQVIPKWNTPKRFHRGPKKDTFSRPQRGTPNRVVFWNRPASRKKGAKTVSVPVFLLVPKVEREERLNFMEVWEAQTKDRKRRWRKMLDNIITDVVRGKT